MIKLSQDHRQSLARAICIIRLRARHQPIPKFRKEWERDLLRLRQIMSHVDHLIQNPMFSKLQDEPTHLNP